MKKLLLLPLLAAALLCAHAPSLRAQSLVYCDVSIAAFCSPTVNPGNGAQGDPAWQAFGKFNNNFSFIAPLWSLGANQLVGSEGSGTLFPITIGSGLTLTAGTLSATGGGGGGVAQLIAGANITLSPTNGLGTVTITASSTAATSFGALTSAANTIAAMVCGSGCTIGVSGTGTITATAVPASGLTGLGTNVATFLVTALPTSMETFLATPTATNLGAAVSGAGLVAGTNVTITGTWPNQTVNSSGSGSTAVTSLTGLGSNTIAGNAGSGAAALTTAQALGVLNRGTCNAQTGTTYTTLASDANGCITNNNASSNTDTVAPSIYTVGDVLTFEQLGAGTTNVTPGSGVTFESLQYGSSTSQTYPLNGIYDVMQLKMVSSNVWLVTQIPGLASLNAPQILTSTGVNLRIQTAANTTSITPTVGTDDQVNQANTQSTGTLTMNNPTGTPSDGQRLTIRITSTNVQTFSWGSAYHAGATALPTATTGTSKHDYFAFIYDAATSQWDYVATAAGF